MSRQRLGPCSVVDCEAHNMRVPTYGRDRLCRDCYVKEAEAGAKQSVETEEPTLVNYKAMSREELIALAAEYKAKAAAATTKPEKNRWKHKARRARANLGPQECLAPGCTVMCEDGNEYCSMSCAGKAAVGAPLRFVPEGHVRARLTWMTYDMPPHPIHGQLDALVAGSWWQSANHFPFTPGV